MNTRRYLAIGTLLLAAAGAASAQDAKFTQTLADTESRSAGIERLSSDQIAVLNALVRRDQKIIAFSDGAAPAPALFSQRLTADERKSAGLDLLTGDELTRLDRLVGDFEAGNLTSARSPLDPALKSAVGPSGPEIHGMISFTYAAGSGGFHGFGGATALSIDDPAHGLSLMVGYAEFRGTGPVWDRSCHEGLPAGYLYGPLPPFVR